MNWGEEFFRDGWKGQPWVVIDRTPTVRTEEEFRAVLRRAQETENWVVGLWKETVLHAPTFGVVAPDDVQRRIISALEAYPARRALEFQRFERSHYERMGWPPVVIEGMTPRPDARLTPEHFRAPILTTVNEGEHFLGLVATSDMIFGMLTRCNIPIDRAAALRLLLTAHGDPGENFKETPFSAPFHPAQFRRLVPRLHGRSPTDPRGELLRVLADQVPSVIESLRRKPAPVQRAHAVGRRRLATAASNVLWPTRRRRVKENPRPDPDERLRSALGTLTPTQRTYLDVLLTRAPLQRALLRHVEQRGWSVAWWRDRTNTTTVTSTLARMRQEVLKKITQARTRYRHPSAPDEATLGSVPRSAPSDHGAS